MFLLELTPQRTPAKYLPSLNWSSKSVKAQVTPFEKSIRFRANTSFVLLITSNSILFIDWRKRTACSSLFRPLRIAKGVLSRLVARYLTICQIKTVLPVPCVNRALR